MSANLHNNDNNDDDIRNPDPIKKDRLIDNSLQTVKSFKSFKSLDDNQLNKILELSKNEFNNSQDIYEKKIIDGLIQESKERSAQFASIKQKLNKILAFDKQNTHIYETILSAIEFYIEGYIIQYKTSKKEFEQIFYVIKTIRLTNEELKHLQNLIVIEE